MSKAKRELTNIKTAEVSLVDKAANKRKFLVVKQEDMEGGMPMGNPISMLTEQFKVPMTLMELIRHVEWMDDDKRDKILASVTKSEILSDLILGLNELEPELLVKATEPLRKSDDIADFIAVLKAGEMPADFIDRRLDNFEGDLNRLDREGHDMLRTIANLVNDFFNRGVKPSDSTFMTPEEPDMVEKASLKPEELASLPENVQGVFKAMETQVTELSAKVEELQKSEDDNSSDPYAGLTPIQKAHQQKLEAKVALLEKAADENETAELIQKAADLKLPEVEGGAFGKVLKDIKGKCSAETFDEVIKALTSASETINKSEKMAPAGHDGVPEGQDTEAELERIAKEIEKDEKCTYPEAVEKAIERNPRLYN